MFYAQKGWKTEMNSLEKYQKWYERKNGSKKWKIRARKLNIRLRGSKKRGKLRLASTQVLGVASSNRLAARSSAPVSLCVRQRLAPGWLVKAAEPGTDWHQRNRPVPSGTGGSCPAAFPFVLLARAGSGAGPLETISKRALLLFNHFSAI